MADDLYAVIADAIRTKKQIVAMADGYEREMCPHTLGTKNGKPQALFYQFAGGSNSGLGSSGSSFNWRCIPLAKLSNVHVREGPWHTAPDHTRRQTCVGRVEVEVSY